ncbi:hypothetical protein [Bradyrhizobium sp. JYMT SZCCT0428]|uniref:hypothetical protein n=1 Tax=Bradyrhizobium sp. JYMT SZCCT0428 TaxID=2807673 RepID=UPI001BA7412D|nr:hypothetical protein [Bradyrhizobium sp. JYMT SZCCT0428]MBR1150729.1 hypothetical protein [Bradyrhizobium sp. JYMT SZCCT0428]
MSPEEFNRSMKLPENGSTIWPGPFESVFEFRQRLELILGGGVDDVISRSNRSGQLWFRSCLRRSNEARGIGSVPLLPDQILQRTPYLWRDAS